MFSCFVVLVFSCPCVVSFWCSSFLEAKKKVVILLFSCLCLLNQKFHWVVFILLNKKLWIAKQKVLSCETKTLCSSFLLLWNKKWLVEKSFVEKSFCYSIRFGEDKVIFFLLCKTSPNSIKAEKKTGLSKAINKEQPHKISSYYCPCRA